MGSFPGRNFRVLDVGGTRFFWKAHAAAIERAGIRVTLLNLKRESIPPDEAWLESVAGNALDEGTAFDAHDVVVSNSLIEHLGSRENMRRFADRLRRSGKPYYVQTPGYWFPLEPHARLPGFQFLPRGLRAWLIWKFRINYFPAAPTYEGCLEVSDSTIMLRHGELQELFPEADIWTEVCCGLPKSYTAFHGFGGKR